MPLSSDYAEEYGILADPDILSETYIPANIPGREQQIQELRFCLTPATRKEKPMNAWLYGRPGTGKTATVRYLLQQLAAQGAANRTLALLAVELYETCRRLAD